MGHGGIHSLLGVLDTYGGELYADFLRFYGLRLDEEIERARTSGTFERLEALVMYLPADSAYKRAENPWTVEERLLNTIVATTAAALTGKNRKPLKLDPLGDAERKSRPAATFDQVWSRYRAMGAVTPDEAQDI